MKGLFSELAKQELEDAANRYEKQKKDLGKRFKGEVKMAALRIAKHP